MREAVRGFPSPLLEYEHVRELLIEANRQAGARGGSLAPVGGARSFAAHGGRVGGGVGARLFTRVWGAARPIPVGDHRAAIAAVRTVIRAELFCDGPMVAGDDTQIAQAAVMGTGWFNMNTAVVQLQWSATQVMVTAHALEGLIQQDSVGKALDRISQEISPGKI